MIQNSGASHFDKDGSQGRTAFTTLELVAIGKSTGVVIPNALLGRMKVACGDVLYLVETTAGYLLTPCGPAVAAQVEAGRGFMNRYRDTFKTLAQ